MIDRVSETPRNACRSGVAEPMLFLGPRDAGLWPTS
jgi:hypothetical protein